MGLLYDQVKYVAKACYEHKIKGKIITLGRIDVFCSIDNFFQLMVELGLANINDNEVEFKDELIDTNVRNIINSGHHINVRFNNPRFVDYPIISDELFFTALGFRHIDCVDVLKERGDVSIIFDLNQPDILSVLDGDYDLVLDCGVMEHVFDVRRVFVHITDLLKAGGHAIHIMPGNNTFDHGFYQFSPTLFHDYYKENKFNIKNIEVMAYKKNSYANPDLPFVRKWDLYRSWSYDPVCFPRNSFGNLGDDIYFTCVCVQKDAQSMRDRAPTQYLFQIPRQPYKSPW